MKHYAKPLFIVAILAVIIISGLSFRQSETIVLPVNKSKKEQPTNYQAVTPHFGPLIQTMPITVTFDGNFAVASILNNSKQKLSTSMPVVLYDKRNNVLPLGGKIKNIELDQEMAHVTIQLPPKTRTAFLSSKMDIITLETIASKRLPHSVYQKDNSGKTYVWVAKQSKDNEEHYHLKKLYINIGMQDLIYFEEAGYKIQARELVIVNPDSMIKENSTHKLIIKNLNAPLHNPIKQAWVDFEMNRLRQQQKDLKEIAENCGKKQTIAKSGTNGSTSNDNCGTTLSDPTDPFTIFQSLINQSSNR